MQQICEKDKMLTSCETAENMKTSADSNNCVDKAWIPIEMKLHQCPCLAATDFF